MAEPDYLDKWIECGADRISVRAYYFPWGAKHIPYSQIRGIERTTLDVLNGRLRIWGTSNPRYWYSLDPGRPHKSVGFVLAVGSKVQPVLTPDRPDEFEEVVRRRVTSP